MNQAHKPSDSLSALNQPPLFMGTNAYRGDSLLVALAANFPSAFHKELEELGQYVFSFSAQELARMANHNVPQLHAYGPGGERWDRIEFHPSWHVLLRRSIHDGLHCSIWDRSFKPVVRKQVHKIRAARLYLMAQLEAGHLISPSMTSASMVALMTTPSVHKDWAPKIFSREYDSTNKAPMQKNSVTIGLGLTEKKGGTDIAAITSQGQKISDGIYCLSGHKWFLSSPMSDAFIMLARVEGLFGCFLVPRILEDGSPNGLFYQRLKNKVGNRSNATVEVEFSNTFGFLLGELGVNASPVEDMKILVYLDCAIMSVAGMRASLAEAIHYARRRYVDGGILIDQPVMKRVLADISLDVAAATALSFRLANAFDEAKSRSEEAAYARIMAPITKYWCCKISPTIIAEAMECIGGSGYVEERAIGRHYRESPANSILLGSGNAMVLDVLKILEKGSNLFEHLFANLEKDLSLSGKKVVSLLQDLVSLCKEDKGSARFLVEKIAVASSAAALYQVDMSDIADIFLEARFFGNWQSTYGMHDRFNASQMIDRLYLDH
ncbi:acyl-CoA dehydrogenase family protein [Candidatus Liberibacter africanus]|uniref:Acyl-CoA dehydrogenase protein n=1 Tax=Candidatus Liberibacter africanus PTSAPSY TaxID=1277257 RepID=A0A0G3I5X2_LIBAF|nr:acyl-CoA dehydrogenase family protein [Candidatus Liberibacter africanus]AKK19868.1 acyl-CoA dehydrogenase protein [Candidatus Liberibacter africanus PTSAPSY]QTP63724.1 acyl-CoA dehydrogenase family protein [Candidatus Liberibacter africanus]